LANVKKVLDSLQADIIAVQEVSDDSTFYELVRQLGHYKATCSDRYSYSFEGPSNFPPQKVCFIYDTLTVDALSTRVLFEDLYDSARLFDSSLLPGYPSGSASSFYSSGRLPFLLQASVTIEGVETTLYLIDVHAKSGATAGDRERRAYDTRVLKDSLDAQFQEKNFIILGDLNDDVDQSIATGLASPYIDYVTDSANYFIATKALSEAGARSTVSFADVIDHQILSNELNNLYLGAAKIITPFSLIPNYANTTSDHLPVITRYKLSAPRINFTQTERSISEGNTTFSVELHTSQKLATDHIFAVSVTGNALVNQDYQTSVDSSGTIIYVPIYRDSAAAHFNITIIDDSLDETSETAIFTIQSGYGFVAGDSSIFTLTIDDNDIPEIAFTQIIASAYEGSGNQKIKLKLSTPVATNQNITIQVHNSIGAQYGTDYATIPAAINNRINLTASAGSDEVALVITPYADSKREIAELVTFQITAVSTGLKIKNPALTIFSILDSRLRNIFLHVAPNPTVNTARLVVEGIEPSEIILLELRRSTGELLINARGPLDKVNEVLENKIQSVTHGIYILKVNHDGETYQLRIVKS